MSYSCRAAVLALPPLAILLLLWCGQGGESRPFLAPLLLASGGLTNGTSLLELLALSHIQHKLDTLSAIADLFAPIGNFSSDAGRRRRRRRGRRRSRRPRRGRRHRRTRALLWD